MDMNMDTVVNRDSDLSQPVEDLHANEQLKHRSQYLRGNIADGLKQKITGAVPGDDPLLMKFHGIYQQDDRDVRRERADRKLEPIYQFMVRLRIPGGVLTRAQWLGLDRVSRTYAERGLRITTRQTIQLHGIRKRKLQACMRAIRDIGLDTVAACGDDSRGVVCGTNPALSEVHRQVVALAQATSRRLIPKTSAYAEIWYDEKPLLRDAKVSESELQAAVRVEVVLPSNTDGLTADKDGNVYLTALQLNGVLKWDPSTRRLTQVAYHPEMAWPDTLAWAPDGALHVISNNLHLWVDGDMNFESPETPNFTIWKLPVKAKPYLN